MRTFPKVVMSDDEFNEVSPFHSGIIRQLIQQEYNVICWFDQWVNDGINASGSAIYMSSGNGRFCVVPVQSDGSFTFTIKKLSE